MLTAYNHIRMSSVDKYDNVEIFYPETTAVDVLVKIDGNENIPQGVDNIQRLVNELAVSAFTNPISDEVTASTATWSSRKINSELETVNTTINNSVNTLNTAISNTNTELSGSISNVRNSLTNSINNVNNAVNKVKVYVGEDELLHFVDSAGTDSALNFKKASGTATADQVLTGYTFSNSSGTNLPGSMTNNGAVTKTLSPGSSYTIPKGYHNGSGVITGGNNENTLTYTFSSGSTGTTVDLGVSNTYRYVNAENVYSKGSSDGYNSGYNSGYSSGRSSGYNSGYSDGYSEGYSDGKAAGTTTHTGTYTPAANTANNDMGVSHTYRYVNTSGLLSANDLPSLNTVREVGDTVYATIVGYDNDYSDTFVGDKDSNYPFKIVSLTTTSIGLLGTYAMDDYRSSTSNYKFTGTRAKAIRWTVTFAAGVLANKQITKTCYIPTFAQVSLARDIIKIGENYWTSTNRSDGPLLKQYYISDTGGSDLVMPQEKKANVVPFAYFDIKNVLF